MRLRRIALLSLVAAAFAAGPAAIVLAAHVDSGSPTVNNEAGRGWGGETTPPPVKIVN
jgi:hypothetical protein